MCVPKVVIVVAYLLGRSDVLGPAAVQVLSRLAFFVASPALLFVTLAHADVGAVFFEALLVTAVTSSVACLLYLPVGLLRRRPPGETAVGAMASGYVNAGNLGIPIATYALGNAAEVAPVMLFQLTVLAPLFYDGARPDVRAGGRRAAATAADADRARAQPDRAGERRRPARLGDGTTAARCGTRSGGADRKPGRAGDAAGVRAVAAGRARPGAGDRGRPWSPCCCSRISCSRRWRWRSAWCWASRATPCWRWSSARRCRRRRTSSATRCGSGRASRSAGTQDWSPRCSARPASPRSPCSTS